MIIAALLGGSLSLAATIAGEARGDCAGSS
jgi:hypothetical protein